MVRIREVDGGRGLAFFDPIENVHAAVHFGATVTPIDADHTAFPVPVDRAVDVRADSMTITGIHEVTVRDAHGNPLPSESTDPRRTLPAGTYAIEVATPLKLCLRICGEVTLTQADEVTTVSLDTPTWISIGARAMAEKPIHTVTTTLSANDLFDAVSTFGSAMHSWGPERSFPSARGHPPTLEVGDHLAIPETLEPPRTDIRLELPADPTNAAFAAPLAYYLGARLEPGERARLVLGEAGSYSLATDAPLGAQCSALLDRVLFFDCLSRGAWGYDTDLEVRNRLRDRIDLDLDGLASLPVSERVWRYLTVPIDRYGHHIPDWRRREEFVLTRRGVQSLPYLAFDLIELREPTPLERNRVGPARLATDGGTTIEHRGIGDRCEDWYRGLSADPEAPIGVSELYPAAYENRLDRGVDKEGISIVVVCNDDKMADELDRVWSTYDRRDDPFVRVRRYERLTCTELEYVLQRPVDYLHYIGHIEPRGFQCADGFVDCSTLDEVAVEAAFLNACDSIEQANALITAGAAGAIATRTRVLNKVAVAVGHQLSGLLIQGFPIGGAIDLLRPQGLIGRQYTVLGDPTLAITQADSVIPIYCEIDSTGNGQLEIAIGTMVTSFARTGSASSFRLGDGTPYYLNPTRQRFTVDRKTLEEFFARETIPVMVDGRLRWNDEPLDRLISGTGD